MTTATLIQTEALISTITSDIDALCVAPKDIDRTLHFFGMLAPKLKEIFDFRRKKLIELFGEFKG